MEEKLTIGLSESEIVEQIARDYPELFRTVSPEEWLDEIFRNEQKRRLLRRYFDRALAAAGVRY